MIGHISRASPDEDQCERMEGVGNVDVSFNGEFTRFGQNRNLCKRRI
jgi:hypothetical protein